MESNAKESLPLHVCEAPSPSRANTSTPVPSQKDSGNGPSRQLLTAAKDLNEGMRNSSSDSGPVKRLSL